MHNQRRGETEPTDGFDLKEFALARGSLVFLADMLGLAPPSLPFLAAHA